MSILGESFGEADSQALIIDSDSGLQKEIVEAAIKGLLFVIDEVITAVSSSDK